VNKTDISEKIRRNYPKYNNSLKSEWIGIVHHQQEINDELAKLEKEIKLLTAKGLRFFLRKTIRILYLFDLICYNLNKALHMRKTS